MVATAGLLDWNLAYRPRLGVIIEQDRHHHLVELRASVPFVHLDSVVHAGRPRAFLDGIWVDPAHIAQIRSAPSEGVGSAGLVVEARAAA